MLQLFQFMDESLLQNRLSQIEQRQYLIILLLIVPYFIGLAKLIGYVVTGLLVASFGFLAFVFVAISRRSKRNQVEQ